MLFWMLVAGLCTGIGWFLMVDKQIRESFSALQWALPARIYARPVELYAGARLDVATLRDTLQRLSYREVSNVSAPGDYQVQGNRVRLHTRGFEFWDSTEAPVLLEVVFSGPVIAQILNRSGSELPLARLEPIEIAQINPDTGEDRLPLVLQDVPGALIDAVIAVEDHRFYSHHGIDPLGITRAMLANLRAGRIVQGGSTLTQQLVKNLYLYRDQTLRRKIEEAMMAVALDMRFSKDDILEAYMNEVFLSQEGNRAIHGFALGAEYFFGRPLNQLSLAELALLAGMPRGPSIYNPRRNPERAISRRNVVLSRMQSAGFITEQQSTQALNEPLELSPRPATRSNAYPAFMDLVRRDLARDYAADALRNDGLRIFTTLDVAIQSKMESQLDRSVSAVELSSTDGVRLEAAMVITDATTGEVRALAGSRRAGSTGFNRAVRANRPIGSLVKPAVYLAALESGQFNLASVLSDTQQTIPLNNRDVWEPRNYDQQTYGDIYLHEALERSLNLATVDLGMRLGVAQTADMLARMGVSQRINHYPSLLLGAIDMTPTEVAQMYQTLAAGGFRSPLRAVEAVTTGHGERLQRYGIASEQITDPINIYLLEYALQGVFYRGTARGMRAALDNQLPLAGKTGTTNDSRDSWFAGYGDDLVGVVWLGYDDNRDTGLSGSSGALRVWTDIMRSLDVQPRISPLPAGATWRAVSDYPSRSTAHRDCRSTRSLPFAADRLAGPETDCESGGSLLERVFDNIRSSRP
jgi:penicillin-binding protein 1B